MNKVLNIQLVTVHPQCQSRVAILESDVDEYAELMKEGVEFPPISVKHDGQTYFVYDGFHRFFAAKKIGKASIACNVEQGSLRDAILASLSVNSKHGIRRSIQDKRKAVMTMLEDFEWGERENREIARHCDVSHPFVMKLRKELQAGNVTSSNKSSAKKEEPKKQDLKKAIEEEVPREEHDQNKEVIDELVERNAQLEQRLAVELMEATPEEKEMANSLIDELREEVRLLKIENESLSVSRDTFQAENAQLKKQVKMLQKKLKDAGID